MEVTFPLFLLSFCIIDTLWLIHAEKSIFWNKFCTHEKISSHHPVMANSLQQLLSCVSKVVVLLQLENSVKWLTFWTFNSFIYPLLVWFSLSLCVCTLFSRLFQSFNLILFSFILLAQLQTYLCIKSLQFSVILDVNVFEVFRVSKALLLMSWQV